MSVAGIRGHLLQTVSESNRPRDPVRGESISRHRHLCIRTANPNRDSCLARHGAQCRVDSSEGDEVEAPRNVVLVAVAVIAVEGLFKSGSGSDGGGTNKKGSRVAREGQGSWGEEDDQRLDREHGECVIPKQLVCCLLIRGALLYVDLGRKRRALIQDQGRTSTMIR